MDGNQQCKPSFFTIIRDGYNTQHMMVPPKFLKYLDKEFCSNDTTTIMCPNGEKWQVTILKKGDNIFMSHGWSQFLKDNSVLQCEFLVFTYDGKNCFQVQIFGIDGTDYWPMLRTKNSTHTKNCASGSSHINESKPSQEELASLLPKDNPSVPKAEIERRSNDCNLVESFTSNNPFFKHLMKKTNVNIGCFLNIATEFAKKHLLPTVKEMRLENSSGKCWEVAVTCHYTNNRRYHRFSKGWSRFVYDNKLKIGDTSIFELEGGNNMRIHIFRCPQN